MIEKKLNIDLSGNYKPFSHFYQATGYANADYTYTPAVQRMYDYESSYAGHIRYMRLHNIMTLHGKGDYYKFSCHCDYGNPTPNNIATKGVDTVVVRSREGKLSYNWKFVDKVYDTIISHEMKPIVEMVYIPSAIQNPAYPAIPVCYQLWGKVVKDFVQHWTKRYGREEVASWYFELINEPENYPVMNERPETLFALYDYFEDAVHSVDSSYCCGGPATKQWEAGKRLFDLFLQHCESGVNFANGEFGARLDFISVHCKGGRPGISVSPDMNYMFSTLREYAALLKKYPKFLKTPFFNDESDIVWEGNMGVAHASWLNFRNTEYAPGFVCKMVNTYCDVIEDELGLNLAIVDSDNSHLPWEVSLFSGNRSQMTPLGKAPTTDIIRKAFFNAYVLLARLGEERLVVDVPDAEFGVKYGCLTTRSKAGYALMLWNFEDGLDGEVNARKISLSLTGLGEKGRYKVVTYRIDRNHANAYGAWMAMGRPYPLAKEQILTLRDNDFLAPDSSVPQTKGDRYTGSFEMPMHSVVLLLLIKDEERQPETLSLKKPVVEKGTLGDKQVFLSWSYTKRPDFVGYEILRDDKIINNRLLADACFVDGDVEKGKKYIYAIRAVYTNDTSDTKPVEVVVE